MNRHGKKRLPRGVFARAEFFDPSSPIEWVVMCPGCGDLVPAGEMMSLPMRAGFAICAQCWAEIEAEHERPIEVGPKHAALCALVPVAP